VEDSGCAAVIYFAPEPDHMHIDDVIQWSVTPRFLPYIARDHFTGNDLALTLNQIRQKLKFPGSEIQSAIVAPDGTSNEIHFQVHYPQSDDRLGLAAPQKRTNTREEFGEDKWLYQIVVRARVEPLHAIFDGIFCGQYEHGNLHPPLPHRGKYLNPAAAGKHDIQQYEIE
jgi:hypothetical protein